MKIYSFSKFIIHVHTTYNIYCLNETEITNINIYL